MVVSRRATGGYRRNNTGTPTRVFYLNVIPIVFHATQSRDANITSYEVAPGIYFYMSKSYRLQSSAITQQKIASQMASHIIKLIDKEAHRLMKFWYDTVNLYFNRRAYGIRYRRGPRRVKYMQQLGKITTPYIANTRQHTGQLRRSITLSKLNIYGAELFARPVHAKTNNRDYIDILMNNKNTPSPGAYIPALDLRIKSGMWHGIPQSYWLSWQARFIKEVRLSEARLNAQIERYVESMKVLTTKEIRAARSLRHNKEFVREVAIDERNFAREMSKSKYKRPRGLDVMDEPWEFKDTWEGMKAQYYAENIPRYGLSWTVNLNTVIRTKRKMSGRG